MTTEVPKESVGSVFWIQEQTRQEITLMHVAATRYFLQILAFSLELSTAREATGCAAIR
jgi:hypothetical protein